MNIRPRSLAHQGWVQATAFLFHVEHVGEAEARRRVLAMWTPGAEVFRLEQGLLLRLPAPRLSLAEQGPGTPLTAAASPAVRVLSTAPLTTEEVERLQPPPGSVVLIAAGAAAVITLTADQWEDPAVWLDLSAWRELPGAASLGAHVPAPVTAVEPVTFDPRQRFRGVPPADPRMEAVLTSLKNGRGFGARTGVSERLREMWHSAGAAAAAGLGWLREMFQGTTGGGASQTLPAASGSSESSAPPPGWLVGVIGAVAALLGSFFALFGAGAGGRAADSTPSRNSAPVRPREPSALLTDLKRLLSRIAMGSQLGRLLGRRQAQYVAKMMELFERGELTDALRHAIPLGGVGDGRMSWALGVPTPRFDLLISPFALAGGGSSLGASAGLYGDLERLYRRAFERLRDLGRIDEAAFVLAELLHVDEEAVAFLESHGKLRLAAELAEGRNLPAGLVVRQWWIAGDRERAVALARRNGAFAEAVAHLERSDPAGARELRMIWAQALATAGDYAQAVEVVWLVPEKREAALEWMDHVFGLGGTAAARMLARKAVLVPEAASEVRDSMLALLADEDREAVTVRHTFANTLRQGERTPLATTLARAVARAVARDAGAGIGEMSRGDFRKLLDFSGDAALRADAPTLTAPSASPLHLQTEPMRWSVEAGDVGAFAVSDAAYLPGGRCVVALGEAGVRLLSREGRTIAHFDQPAQRLVLSDHGDRVIALAERGGVYRLARIDLLARIARPWCEADLECFADTYDGSTWLVANKGGLLALDAAAPGLSSLWTTREVGVRIGTLNRDRAHASLLTLRDITAGPEGTPVENWERWLYDLPSLVLRYRTLLVETAGGDWVRRVSPAGLTTGVESQPCPGWPGYEFGLCVGGHEITDAGAPVREAPNHDGLPLFVPVLTDDWLAYSMGRSDAVECWLVDTKERRIRANWMLGGARRVKIRLQEGIVTVADDRGRVLILDIDHGRLLRDLRVR